MADYKRIENGKISRLIKACAQLVFASVFHEDIPFLFYFC